MPSVFVQFKLDDSGFSLIVVEVSIERFRILLNFTNEAAQPFVMVLSAENLQRL